MAYLSVVEAAIKFGFSVELVEKLMETCPKSGESRTLAYVEFKDTRHIDEDEAGDYLEYLRKPWPVSSKAKRPYKPPYINEDVKAESHYRCAICGSMNGGEVAHIDPVRDTLDNSPDNLVLLCPDHHTEYDYGHRPSSNVTRRLILAAKEVKRASRRRMLRFEANTIRALELLLRMVSKIERQAAAAEDQAMASVYTTELRALVAAVPDLCEKATDAAAKDTGFSDAEKAIIAKAPALSRLALTANAQSVQDQQVRSAAQQVIDVAADVFLDLDEVDCPHCKGHGQKGLLGDLCVFCKGSCYVSQEKSDAYEAEDIDEVNCPHCDGRGETGLVGDICRYCRGGQVVSQEKSDAYEAEDIDEVNCPHCDGRGETGLVGDICRYCRGGQVVSQEKSDAYEAEDIDEVNCPHCDGRGETGLVGDICRYCRGGQVVSQEKSDAYEAEDIDEVNCPHCDGNGQKGSRGDLCVFCKGSCSVSQEKFHAYEAEDIDEVDCPRCDGRGETGLVGNVCKLCKGATVVGRAIEQSYRKRFE